MQGMDGENEMENQRTNVRREMREGQSKVQKA